MTGSTGDSTNGDDIIFTPLAECKTSETPVRHLHDIKKSCYNPLRLGTETVLVSSGIDFVNTPRLYSDRATR